MNNYGTMMNCCEPYSPKYNWKRCVLYAGKYGGTAPIVVSGPHYMKNHTGGSAALSCEIIGDPIPFVSWLKTDVNNKTYELPGDDKNMMTLTQGGPEKHEVTAWLQIMKLRKGHEGDYSCVAFNKHGTAKRTARLNVGKNGHVQNRKK